MSLTFFIGQKINRWTILSFSYKDEKYHGYWNCKCECGTERIVRASCLFYNKTISCGCYAIELSRGRKKPNRNTPEYTVYYGMITRCYNENTDNYDIYGGRGIKVCDRWIESFDNFMADMGKRPSDEHSLDRFPDNDGNYEPSNCRWATQQQQMSNVSYNVWIEYNGVRKIATDWARHLKVSEPLLRYHLKKQTFPEAYEYLKDFKGRKKICIGRFKDGELVKTYNKAKELYEDGFGISNVYICLRGESPLYKGYQWKYINEKAA